MMLGPILYKCEVCGWQTRKERVSLTCPECGKTLVSCSFSMDEPGNFLSEDVYETFPCVLAHEYKRLCNLAIRKPWLINATYNIRIIIENKPICI